MVESINRDEIGSTFSIENLLPKRIINTRGDIRPFNPEFMIRSLNKETGLDWDICVEIVKDSLKRIIPLRLDEVNTNMVREIVCLELTSKGLLRERNIYAKMINRQAIKFELDKEFLEKFQGRQPNWGPLGYITYKRTYARLIEEENRTEEFWETLKRVVEGCYSIQKEHCFKLGLPWDDRKSQNSAQIMYQKMWQFKFLPPGRGLWMMGTEFIDKHGSMALNNCGFVSTQDIHVKKTKPFEWLMDALMLGVGVGFDTKGADKLEIQTPKQETFVFEVPDSREGWVQALRHLLRAYFEGDAMPIYDFSKVRPKGALIRGFGGVASGPEPLREMLNSQEELLKDRIGKTLSSVDIVDMMNYIGKCVVAGNVRRSAEIALGDFRDEEYIHCKEDEEALYDRRWASNNSIFGEKGMDYERILDGIREKGEPGIIWMENARAYSRMNGEKDWKDKNAAGVNPCISGDTLIAVADGRDAVPIKQLAEEKKDVPVYCKDKKGLTRIRMMRNPRITGYEKEIFEVKLDDGSTIKCTGNHKFLLRNKELKMAKNLEKGDSLMLSTKWQTTWSEIMGEEKKKKSVYWMTNDGKKNLFEHTLFYQELSRKKIRKGFIIHHKDKDGLNNNFENLEVMDRMQHDSLHDISGENNPMVFWWNKASKEEKERYRQKMSEAVSNEKNPNYSGFTDEQILQEMINIIEKTRLPLTFPSWRKHSRDVGMPHTSPRWGAKQTPMRLIRKANEICGFNNFEKPAIMREYKRFIRRQKNSDMDIFFNKCTYVKKDCELCGEEFVVKWGKREQAFCSHACSNKIVAREAGRVTKELAKERHKEVRRKMVEIFETIVSEKESVPSKGEFLQELKKHEIADLRTAGFPDSYQKFLELISKKYQVSPINTKKLQSKKYRINLAKQLKDNGLSHNHKVASIRQIGKETVYNGTVDDFHNYGIILDEKETESGKPKLEMIFTRNCGEQTLESYELCCLVETFPSHHENYDAFQHTLKYAYLYAKSVTLINTHWNETNAVMGKNRRIGTSQTGIIEAFAKHGRRNILNWCEKGYGFLKELDAEYSDFFCVPKSRKITTVKPSGTTSLLPGVSAGIHYHHSRYYIRRIRVSKGSDLLPLLEKAGYPIEDDSYAKNSRVVEFPIYEPNFLRAKKEVSIWEQAANAIDYQRYWCDNQVSITVTFGKHEEKDLKYLLQFCEDKLKGISLLPLGEGVYKQMPYETISKEEYERRIAEIKPIEEWVTGEKGEGTYFCDGDQCEFGSEAEEADAEMIPIQTKEE